MREVYEKYLSKAREKASLSMHVLEMPTLYKIENTSRATGYALRGMQDLEVQQVCGM
jgi:hypothetical protein